MTKTPFLYKEPEPSDLKLQETRFFVSKISYYFLVNLKPNLFHSNIFMFSFKANLEMKKTPIQL